MEDTKTNNMINLTPDIDWRQQSVTLCTERGIEHRKTDELTNPYVRMHLNRNHRKIYVYFSIKDNYLSMKTYTYSWSYFRGVTEYRNAEEANCHLTEYVYPYNWYCDRLEYINPLRTKLGNFMLDAGETRIYKDRKVSYVAHGVLTDKDGNEQECFIVNPQIRPHIVTTDAEIEKYASRIGRASVKKYMPASMEEYYLSDLRHQMEDRHSGQEIVFADSTTKLLEEFFQLTSKENEQLLKLYIANKGWSPYYNRKDKEDKITTVSQLANFLLLQTHETKDPFVTKLERAEKIGESIPNFLVNKDIDDNFLADWYRIGDDIVCYYQEHKHRYLFAYNVKTKKRFYGEAWLGYSGNPEWVFPIPSLDTIRSITLDASYITTTVHCDSVLELFAGSNVEYLIKNAGDDFKIIDRNTSGLRPQTIAELISLKHIPEIIFKILFSTGEPVKEQFLKSKLFNLYAKSIESNWLIENKTDASKITETIRYYSGELEYLSKEKNLKKMFGMNMDQLRILDSRCALRESNSFTYYRAHYYLYGAEKFFGMNLCDLDVKTFNTLLDFVEDTSISYYDRPLITISDVILHLDGFLNNIRNQTPRQKIEILNSLKSCGMRAYSINDYYRARESLKEIQAKKPDIPDIWSEKHYPLVPSAGTRFLPYMPGVMDMAAQRVFNSELEMTYYYDSTYVHIYKQAEEGCELTPIYDDNKKFLGIVLRLNRGQMFRFLHNEINSWVSFFTDQENITKFAKAVKRVNSLCWRDEEMGLEIVAPQNIADLKNEGHVLDHCVGTYARAIIEGKNDIVFLRRTDMPSAPFFTIDIDLSKNKGELRQIHCYQNKDLTAESQRLAYEKSRLEVYNKTFDIIKFLQRWAEAKPGKIKASSIRSSYQMLCART